MVKFGYNKKILVKGKGKILIQARNNDHLYVFDIFMFLGWYLICLVLVNFKKEAIFLVRFD